MDLESKLAELNKEGFSILRAVFPKTLIEAARREFWPVLTRHLHANIDRPNRGPHRHYMAMPFNPPIFSPEFFFNPVILALVREMLGDTAVADQWGCDVPIAGSIYQDAHRDFQRPLFPKTPDLLVPPYILMVSFALLPICHENGPLEIAAGTHQMGKDEAIAAVSSGLITLNSIHLEPGDVLIRNPWTLHRGTPNHTETPRPLLTIRYVRSWYYDNSREVETIPGSVWDTLSAEQRRTLRFPGNAGFLQLY